MATSSLVHADAPIKGIRLSTALRRFAPYLRPYVSRFSLLVAFLIITTIASLAQMYVIMVGTNYMVSMQGMAGMTSSQMQGMPGMKGMSMPGMYADDLHAVGIAAVLFVVLQLAMSLIKLADTVVMSRVAERLSVTIRQDLLRRLHRLTLDAHRRQVGGEWISRVLFDVDRLRNLLASAVLKTTYSVLFLVASCAFLFVVNPAITLPVIVILPIMVVISYRWSRRLQPSLDDQQRSWDHVVGFMTERLDGLLDIRASGCEERVLADFDRLTVAYRDKHTRTAFQRAGIAAFLEMCTFFVTGLLIWFGGLQFLSPHANQIASSVFAGAKALMPMGWMLLGTNKMMASMGMAQGAALSAGALSAFVLFAGRMVAPIRMFSHQYGELAQMKVSSGRLLSILDRAEEREHGISLPALDGRIAFEHVTFGYQPDHAVLKDVSLGIEPGEHVVFVGPTGAGKTTLMHLVSRFYEPAQGRIAIDGYDLHDVALSSLREQVVSVPQETELFDSTVMENIRFGKPAASDTEVMEAARAIGADELFHRLRKGYQTQIGEGGSRLSAGQRQLVALARAMVASPRIIVLDEALSNVDTGTQDIIMEALRRLWEGRTTLLVAHDLNLAWQADRVVVIDDGQVVESGPAAVLLARGGRFAALWQAQQGSETATEAAAPTVSHRATS